MIYGLAIVWYDLWLFAKVLYHLWCLAMVNTPMVFSNGLVTVLYDLWSSEMVWCHLLSYAGVDLSKGLVDKLLTSPSVEQKSGIAYGLQQWLHITYYLQELSGNSLV